MENTLLTERLMEFGLTRQEAGIYQCLLGEGKASGYEVAKLTGISRSNAYNSLASMTEKGASYLVEEGSTRKYVPVPLDEFCHNRIRKLEESRQWMEQFLPREKQFTEGYITIEGNRHVLDKMKNLLGKAEDRIYISCTRNYLLLMVAELEELIADHKKVVIITDQPVSFDGAKVYVGTARGVQVGLIVDSKYVLTGEYGEGSTNSCLYTGQKFFVDLYKKALSNEIKLLTIQEERRRK